MISSCTRSRLIRLQRRRSLIYPRLCFIPRRNVSMPSSPMKSARDSVLPLAVVQDPKIQAALPFIGNIAYVALASGFLMTDMLSLRILLAGGYAGLVAFHMLHVKPLKIPLRWSALFVLVNAGAAALLLADQWMGNLSAHDQALYHQHFAMLTPGQFHQLLKIARTEVLPTGTALTQEGQPCKNLYFIRRGVANLYLKELFMSRSEVGSFVNDVAFQQGQGVGAYGTVVTAGECVVLVWNAQTLQEQLVQQPAMKRNLNHCFASHLVKALLEQREAAHLTSGRWADYQVPHFTMRKTVDVKRPTKRMPKETKKESSS